MNFFYRKIRANKNINKNNKLNYKAYKEHRLRGDLFYNLIEKLRAYKRRANNNYNIIFY
jgi:hypothetical protein